MVPNRCLPLLLVLSLLLSSCASSLVYDPSLHLPARTLDKGQIQGGAGVSYLLETRPNAVNQTGETGASFLLRGQFSQDVSVRVGHWFTFSGLKNDGEYRGGVAADVTITLSQAASGGQFFLIPRSAIVFAERPFGEVTVDGAAFALQGGMTTQILPLLRLYGGVGPVFGLRNLSEGDQWGAGGLLNAGLGLSIMNGLSASAELSGVAYYNADEQKAMAALSPSLMISFTF